MLRHHAQPRHASPAHWPPFPSITQLFRPAGNRSPASEVTLGMQEALAAYLQDVSTVGADLLGRGDDIMRMFRSRTLPLDLRSSLRAGEVAAALRRHGNPIGFADCLQAGICLRHNLPLATRNRNHFSRVGGLILADLDELG
jgi:hypothetical protein